MENIDHSQVIDRLGGNVAVAAMFKVSRQAVSQWRTDGIPAARLMYIEAVHPHALQEPEKQPA